MCGDEFGDVRELALRAKRSVGSRSSSSTATTKVCFCFELSDFEKCDSSFILFLLSI